MDPFVSEEGAELLAIFVSPRIGEVMPLERVRYISLSYISTSCCCVYPPPPIPSEPIKSQACVNTDGAFVCQALKPPKNSQELGFQCGKNSVRRQADQKMRGEYLAVTHTMDWPLSCV